MGSSGAYYNNRANLGFDDHFAVSLNSGSPMVALKPLIAGARARGICDAFSLLNRAAILLDGFGMVLHANPQAHTLLGQGLWVESGHLIASDMAETRAIQSMIASALAGSGEPAMLRVACQNSKPLSLSVVLMPEEDSDSSQLLKAILLIE